MHSALHLMLIDICIKFREYSLSGYQVIERTPFVTDRRMDAWGKTLCLPTLKGGDIITQIIHKRSTALKQSVKIFYWRA